MSHNTSEFPVRSYLDLLFASPDGCELLLDLFVPQTPKRPPLVVHFHGGAWANGSRKNFAIDWLASHGFAVASATYRYSSQALFPAQIHDCKAAIRWLRAHADQFGYDAERIGVSGCSAGGHLAILLGTTLGSTYHEGVVGEHLEQSSAVDAVLDFYGPSDFILRAQTQPVATDPPESRVYRLLGCTPRDNEELAKLASGVYQVTPASVPFLIFHGEEDKTVFPDQSEKLCETLRQNQVEAVLHLIPNGVHDARPFFTDENKTRIVDFLRRHVGDAR